MYRTISEIVANEMAAAKQSEEAQRLRQYRTSKRRQKLAALRRAKAAAKVQTPITEREVELLRMIEEDDSSACCIELLVDVTRHNGTKEELMERCREHEAYHMTHSCLYRGVREQIARAKVVRSVDEAVGTLKALNARIAKLTAELYPATALDCAARVKTARIPVAEVEMIGFD
ncbi:hypothetical protein PAPYR_11446 [Paratrimastix pyriformis]|uniref:Uncharacterized protein n=1 Tax=Paratrimastix pyriformis TaxID=342808 RepID=A0ABQ8U3R6_9EUKA|nr:hypothetical protein PAPYR_11446 [Paratrimastix pyriformis]